MSSRAQTLVQSDSATLADYIEMTKPRICVLAVIMASLGYYLGSAGNFKMPQFLVSMFGIGLLGAGSGVLNQYIERAHDAKMWRTLNRPLPVGRMEPSRALIWGAILALFGGFSLLFFVGPIVAVLGAITLFLYLAVYTPSKRVSPLSTLIGAVPGAMPPLLGFTAATGTMAGDGLILFGILFLWQIPHFLAIACIYREDYRRADMPVLTVVDSVGDVTGQEAVMYALILIPVTLLPYLRQTAGSWYYLGALVLGILYLGYSINFARYKTIGAARRLFWVSLIYLPALGVIWAWDRVL